MRKITCLFLLFLSFGVLNAQLIRQWKSVAEGSFTGTDLLNNLSISKGRYIAAVPRSNGGDLDSNKFATVLLLSSDSGRTFSKALREKVFSDFYDSTTWSMRFFQSVEMPSENLILLVAVETMKKIGSDSLYPYLMRSTDFGKNWERIRISKDSIVYNWNYLSMLNDTFGILISGRIPTDDNPSKTGFYKTQDGGKTWSESNKFNLFPFDLKCYSENDYIVSSSAGYLKTSNGGESWEKINPPQNFSCKLSFTNQNLLFAYGSSKNQQTQNDMCVIYKSTDAGSNWTKITESISPKDTPLGFEVNFWDEDNGLAIGVDYGEIFRTCDGGQSWTMETTPSECYSEAFKDIRFISKSEAIALTISRIYLCTGKMVFVPPHVIVSKSGSGLLDYCANWTKTAGADKYRLQLAETKSTGNVLYYSCVDYDKHIILDTANLTDTLFNLTGKIRYNKSYYLRVKTYNDNMESDWSKVQPFNTPKDTTHYPQLDTARQILPMQNSFDLPLNQTFVWHSVTGAKFYTLNVTTLINYSLGGYDHVIENLTDTSCSIKLKSLGMQYLWWVIAEADSMEPSLFSFFTLTTAKGTDIKENYENGEIEVRPNPAYGYIEISGISHTLKGMAVEQPIIRIYNIYGELVINPIPAFPDWQELRIDVSGLPSGLYFIRIDEEVIKFVKF